MHSRPCMSLHHSALFRVSDWKHIFILYQASLRLCVIKPNAKLTRNKDNKTEGGTGWCPHTLWFLLFHTGTCPVLAAKGNNKPFEKAPGQWWHLSHWFQQDCYWLRNNLLHFCPGLIKSFKASGSSLSLPLQWGDSQMEHFILKHAPLTLDISAKLL